MSSKLNLDKFQESTKELPILRVHEKDSSLGCSVLQKFTSNLPTVPSSNCGGNFSLGKIIYAVLGNGQVEFTGWAV